MYIICINYNKITIHHAQSRLKNVIPSLGYPYNTIGDKIIYFGFTSANVSHALDSKLSDYICVYYF